MTAVSHFKRLPEADDELPANLDSVIYPLICRHWYGVEIDDEPAERTAAELSRTVQERAAK